MEPNYRINGFDFGRDRSLIREELGNPVRSFQEYESKNTVDVYPSIHVYYSEDNKLEAVEFFGKEIRMSIQSQPVFPGTLRSARKILPDLEDCYGSFISRDSSVGITAENDSIISVLVGCKDYYK